MFKLNRCYLESAHNLGFSVGLTSYYKCFWRLLDITATRRRDSSVASAILDGGVSSDKGLRDVLKLADSNNNSSVNSSHSNSISTLSNVYNMTKVIGAGASIFLLIKAVQLYAESQRQRSQFPSSSDEGAGYNSGSPIGGGSSGGGADLRSLLPPSAPPAGRGGVVPPKEAGLCPLCRAERMQPCASTGNELAHCNIASIL